MKKEENNTLLIVSVVALFVLGISFTSTIKTENNSRNQIEQLSQLSNAQSLKIIALKKQLAAKDKTLEALKKDLSNAQNGLNAASQKVADLTAPVPVAAVVPSADPMVK